MKGVAHVAGGEVRAKLRGLGASVLCASAGSGDAAGAECPLQQETETLVRARRTEVERNHTFDHLQEEGEEQERSLPATPVRSPSSFPPTPVPSPSLQIDEADAQRGIDETRPGQEGGTSRGECEEVAARFPEYSDDLATPACAGAAQGEGGCTALERDETAFLRGWVNPAPEPSMGAMSNCDTDSCRSSPDGHCLGQDEEDADDALTFGRISPYVSQALSRSHSANQSMCDSMPAVCSSCPHSSQDAEEAFGT